MWGIDNDARNAIFNFKSLQDKIVQRAINEGNLQAGKLSASIEKLNKIYSKNSSEEYHSDQSEVDDRSATPAQ
jgi:hypothetical protein